MKRVFAILAVLFILGSTIVFAGGDQNQNRHDGTKGKGNVNQERVSRP
jgi:hypothetical protein